MNKKAIAILGGIFILIVGTLGFIIWYRSGSTEEDPVLDNPDVIIEEPIEETPIEEPIEEEPVVTNDRAVRLTDDAVITPALYFQGDGIAYFNNQGQLFRTQMSISGSTVLLSNKTELVVPPKSNINKILWPIIGNSYLTESGTGISRTWSYYNPDTGTYIDLPSQVKSVSWMPSGNKIIFVWVGGDGKATLNISDPDTNNYQMLTDLYEPDNEISVSPDGQTILFYRNQMSNTSENKINSVTADGKIFNTVVRDGYNKGILWSPDSKKFLFTKLDSSTQKFNLWMADLSSGITKNLGVATSETKAVWSKDGQTILAAVPVSGTFGQGLTSDTIYKIDLLTNNRTEYNPGSGVDVREMFTSLDGGVIFFKNAQDNSLYYLFTQ